MQAQTCGVQRATPLIRNPSRVWNTHGIVEAMQVLFRSRESVAGEGGGGGGRRRR